MTASAAVRSGRTTTVAADQRGTSARDARKPCDAEKIAADRLVAPSAVANLTSADDPEMTMAERIRSDRIH